MAWIGLRPNLREGGAMIDKLNNSKNKRLRQRVIITICTCLFLLAIAFICIITITSKSYFDNHYETRNPIWVTDIFLKGRLFLGRFRPAPSNDEMVSSFQTHQEAFDHLINEYYEQLRLFYASGAQRFPDINAKLRIQMVVLGISKISAAGPYYANSIYGTNSLQRIGVHLLLIDRAGLSSESDQARLYVYVPRVNNQDYWKEPPISWYFGSGEYGPSNSIPAFCSHRDIQCCGLQIFSKNWAIANCIHNAIKN